MTPPVRRLVFASGTFFAIVAVGTVALFFIGGGKWTFGECLYMVIISITTVGFSELPEMASVRGARAVVAVLVILGVGAIAFFQSTLTALFIEGFFGQALRRNRMRKQIASMTGHVVVAGAGSTGRHVIEELVVAQASFVVIDINAQHVERASEDFCNGKLVFVHGDATQDAVLMAAGLDRARGVVCALTHDKDNLFVTLTARSLNPTARIVTKVTEEAAGQKMLRAGASSIVNPTQIGGRRMATELIRPKVNEFLDQLLRDRNQTLRLEEVQIPKGSPLDGATLADLRLHGDSHVMVVAIHRGSGEFIYNPDPTTRVEAGMALIILGEKGVVSKMKESFHTP